MSTDTAFGRTHPGAIKGKKAAAGTGGKKTAGGCGRGLKPIAVGGGCSGDKLSAIPSEPSTPKASSGWAAGIKAMFRWSARA